MGKDFYVEALKIQKSYINVHIENRMQSNLTMLSDDMADFLCANNVGIGSSFDGINNEILRGNSEEILAGRQKLINRGRNCGFIMVLSNKTVDTIIESYEQFKELKANFNMNTYVSTTAINNSELELNTNHTIECLKNFFEYWIKDSGCNIHVDFFERILKFILYREKSVCKYNSCLGKWLGVRYNGDIVPCNRLFPNRYGMGNVWDYSKISDAFQSDGFKLLLTEAISRRYKCQSCEIFAFCTGGCNNVALNENGISNNNGPTCKITKGIYKYIIDYIASSGDNFFTVEHANPMIKKLMSKEKIKHGTYHYDVHHDSVNSGM